MSKVLIYKQTHIADFDDPGESGVFGINDCMGRVRDTDFDHVVGLYKGEVSWVGVDGRRLPWPGHASRLVFDHFWRVLPNEHIPAGSLLQLVPHRAHARIPLSNNYRTVVRIIEQGRCALPTPADGMARAANAPPKKKPRCRLVDGEIVF